MKGADYCEFFYRTLIWLQTLSSHRAEEVAKGTLQPEIETFVFEKALGYLYDITIPT